MGNNKPLELLLKEYKNKLYNSINESQLPISICRILVNEFAKEVNSIADSYENEAIIKYYKEQEESQTQLDIDVNKELIDV